VSELRGAELQKLISFGFGSEVWLQWLNALPRWLIRHGAGDYKTGRSYGERPPLTLAPHIYLELEAFMADWRQHLAPRHDFLFSR